MVAEDRGSGCSILETNLYTAQELLGLAQHTPGATSDLSKHSSVVTQMMQDKLIEKCRYFDDVKTLGRDN